MPKYLEEKHKKSGFLKFLEWDERDAIQKEIENAIKKRLSTKIEH